MQFNYLGESVPSLIDRVRATRVPLPIRPPLLALVTALAVVAAWWILEKHWYARAQQELQRAQTRLAAAQALRGAANIQRSGVEHLLTLDRQLRSVRTSGSLLGVRLTEVANHIPDRVWLTSLAPVAGGIELSGRAIGMARLGETVASLGGIRADTTSLLRATKEERIANHALVAFELRVDE